MAFDINEMKGQMSSARGLARANLFEVSMPVGGKTISLLAHAAQLPGISFDVMEVRRQGYGVAERRAGVPIFQNFTASFLLDNKGEVLKVIKDWVAQVSPTVNVENHAQYGQSSLGGMMGAHGQIGFFDDYTKDIEITMFAPDSSKIIKYKMIDAYPQTVSDVTLGWRQNDEIAELQVTFVFTHWNAETYGAPSGGGGGEDGFNLLQTLSKLNSAVQIVKDFKKPSSIGDALNILNNGKSILDAF